MRRLIPQPVLDRWFRFVIVFKGLDGVFEVLGGVAVLFVPLERIQGAVADLMVREIAEERHAFIANFILQLDHRFNPHIQLFAAIYLLGHGAIKIFLAIALLRQHYHLYPYAIGFLLTFIFYQSYRVGYDHSWGLAALTAFDSLIAWLTYLEWQRHRGSGYNAKNEMAPLASSRTP